MTAGPGKRCLVAVDTVAGPVLCAVQLGDIDTLEAALQCARLQLGEEAADWSAGATGIWGRLRSRSTVVQEGDRVELYRPLGLDPRQRRRQRARAAAGAASRRVNSTAR